MEVEIGASGGVVEVGPLRRGVVLVEAENAQHVDKRWIEIARGQIQRLARTGLGVRDHAEGIEGVGGLGGLGFGVHGRSSLRLRWSAQGTRRAALAGRYQAAGRALLPGTIRERIRHDRP